MDRFEYKVLEYKMHHILSGAWFDGEENVGNETDVDFFNRFGAEGWEVCSFVPVQGFTVSKILMKRRLNS